LAASGAAANQQAAAGCGRAGPAGWQPDVARRQPPGSAPTGGRASGALWLASLGRPSLPNLARRIIIQAQSPDDSELRSSWTSLFRRHRPRRVAPSHHASAAAAVTCPPPASLVLAPRAPRTPVTARQRPSSLVTARASAANCRPASQASRRVRPSPKPQAACSSSRAAATVLRLTCD
jgi:hypothetical protein